MSEAGRQRFLERLPLASDRPVLGYGAAALFSVAGLALRLSVDGVIPPGFPYVTFFPAVILAAFLFGLGPGILAAALCGILSWWFFVGPTTGFALTMGTAIAGLFYLSVVTVDIVLIHWMQGSNLRLARERARCEALARTRSLLFSELQHRVSNNLQVVAALLSLQKKGVADVDARAALDEAARRLALIGKIHRQLYDPEGSRLGMGPFLDQLCIDALDAGGRTGIRHRVSTDDSIEVEADAAIPIALIVAEAIANALEHGFGDGRDGRIDVRLERTQEGGVRLSVRDDGKGLPDGFDHEASPSLGLRIARTLAKQLGGQFELVNDGGTVARLTLPA